MAVVTSLAIYLAIGALVATGFVLRGAGRRGGPAGPVTPGGRAMLWPGALALWPLVAWRWARGR